MGLLLSSLWDSDVYYHRAAMILLALGPTATTLSRPVL